MHPLATARGSVYSIAPRRSWARALRSFGGVGFGEELLDARGGGLGRRLDGRQVDGELRAPARLAVNVDEAAVAADDRQGRRWQQPDREGGRPSSVMSLNGRRTPSLTVGLLARLEASAAARLLLSSELPTEDEGVLEDVAESDTGPDISEGMNSLLDSSKSTSEAFTIIATELIEVKAMLMALIDLQKSALYASGVNEGELETHVRNLIEGYRRRYLKGLEGQVREAAEEL